MSSGRVDGPIRRPRMTPEREYELLSVALEVLREVGYEGLSMELVAARGRCSKATLYRQWENKPKMVATALYATRPVRAEEIDTGSLRGDLLAAAEQLALQAERDTSLLSGLAHAVLADEELAAVVRTVVIQPAVAHVDDFIERAIARGELPGRPTAAVFLPSMLLAASTSRPVFEGRVADTEYLKRLVDDALLPALLNS
ncbi:TetR family transcriptional regulator [Streptomyces sp. SID5914]|nr:TetR/AcrR family transcriptional regulator [Streptomyces sp. SID5914]MZG19563.1 TetR family transcriptional regulator [Streptomyces sp. SID5914]